MVRVLARTSAHSWTPARTSWCFREGQGRSTNTREKYQLIWKERLGFAKLAIEYGYPIIPFAAVGAGDAYDIVPGRNQPVYARFTGLAVEGHRLADAAFARGIGPTLIRARNVSTSGSANQSQHPAMPETSNDSNARRVRDKRKLPSKKESRSC